MLHGNYLTLTICRCLILSAEIEEYNHSRKCINIRNHVVNEIALHLECLKPPNQHPSIPNMKVIAYHFPPTLHQMVHQPKRDMVSLVYDYHVEKKGHCNTLSYAIVMQQRDAQEILFTGPSLIFFLNACGSIIVMDFGIFIILT